MNEINLLIHKHKRLPAMEARANFPAREKAKVLSFKYINELRLMENKIEKFQLRSKNRNGTDVQTLRTSMEPLGKKLKVLLTTKVPRWN